MNYTEKYHLPQWEKTDRIMMEDFNQMCLDMESGLEKTAQDAAADTAAARTANAAAAAKAQSTADTAVSKADAARTVADAAYCPDFKPFVIGSYVGNISLQYADKQRIKLDFEPSFVAVVDHAYGAGTLAGAVRGDTGGSVICDSSGFLVCNMASTEKPNMNILGKTYFYIAFR